MSVLISHHDYAEVGVVTHLYAIQFNANVHTYKLSNMGAVTPLLCEVILEAFLSLLEECVMSEIFYTLICR